MRRKMLGTSAPFGVLASIASLAVLPCLASPKNWASLLPGAVLQADQCRRLPNLNLHLPLLHPHVVSRRRCRVQCRGVGQYDAFVSAARASSHGRLKNGVNRNRCGGASIPRRAGVLKVSPTLNDDDSNDTYESGGENKKSNNKHTALQELQLQRHTLVFELQSDGEQSEEDLAVYGKLHRLLGRRRRLLGANAVAIMTTLNFLVVHYAHDDENTQEQQHQQSSWWARDTSTSSNSGSSSWRLALGDRRWDVCGIGVGLGTTAAQVCICRSRCMLEPPSYR